MATRKKAPRGTVTVGKPTRIRSGAKNRKIGAGKSQTVKSARAALDKALRARSGAQSTAAEARSLRKKRK